MAAGLPPKQDGYVVAEPERLVADLGEFRNLLIKWQKVQNLVSRETIGDIWQRHFDDSLQILNYLPKDCRRILDIGSGGGFPAIPLAIALRKNPIEFNLLEANLRKVAFLKTVSRELSLGLRVHAKRAEMLDPSLVGPVDVITSRAVAPLGTLMELAFPFWSAGTAGIFHKGREFGVELAKSRTKWDFDVLESTSQINMSGVIVEIRQLKLR